MTVKRYITIIESMTDKELDSWTASQAGSEAGKGIRWVDE